ncbi:MAG: ATP-binding cassette domain-containing protein [Lachnospiraceae bacterium]|nr:ATP-binding cassette domain-containing protein [Lachnospiraceae bacterium]MDD3616019.1 ATP-binding cassette domain-containing protein [Lachnospiraceae bacterium]
MSSAILTGKNLTKKNGNNTILDHLYVEIFETDFTVIMGTSGSGKSTLLYNLSGMDRITSGEIKYGEMDIGKLSEKELTKLRASDFGFVFQQMNLVSNLTLAENVKMAGLISTNLTEKEAIQRTELLLEQMNLSEAKNRFPSQSSGGEAQRAAVARAVIGKPKIIFADEPTGALNKANTVDVLNLFTKMNQAGQTIMLVTHDMEAALRGNRLLYLEDGKIIGELKLSHYEGKNKQREEKLEKWLEDMRW